MAAKAKLRSSFVSELGKFEKMTVFMFGKTALHAHIRTYQSALLKTIIKPTSSKAKQVG